MISAIVPSQEQIVYAANVLDSVEITPTGNLALILVIATNEMHRRGITEDSLETTCKEMQAWLRLCFPDHSDCAH